MQAETNQFYELLESFADFSDFHNTQYYQPLPADWCVVITDVEGSTKAIEEGRYKEVNSVGVASIVALNNALKPLKVPYVFGGDGASACVPASVLDIVKPALIAAEKMSLEQFKLKLRIGIVPMSQISEQGHAVLVGNHVPHIHYQQAMFLGDGLGFAEKLIKDSDPGNPYLVREGLCADSRIFDGFECRWNEIPSPHEENISLLVQAFGDKSEPKDRIYAQVLEHVRKIYGEDSQHHPLVEGNLSLTQSFRNLSVESGIRTAFHSIWSRLLYKYQASVFEIGRYLAYGSRR